MKMKQINNNFASYYYLTREGTVYNSNTEKYKEPYADHSFKLKTIEGKYKKVTLRELYKLVYNEYYVIDNIEDLEGEQWKVIEGTNGLYRISSKGRVKSYVNYDAIILKPSYSNGYQKVDIYKNGSRCGRLVSRLVASAFLLPPTDIEMQLHHKNGNKCDNRKENLEWLLPQEHRELHKKLREQQKGE